MASEICQACHGLGVVRKRVPLGHPDFSKTFPCPACTTYQDVMFERIEQTSRLELYKDKTFEGFITNFWYYSEMHNNALLTAYDESRLYTQEFKGWLVFLGGFGTGKSHLAAAIGNEAIRRSIQTIFVTTPDLLDHLRRTFDPNTETRYDQEFDLLCNVQLLILDDLGVESNSPWAQEKLYQIINHRYVKRLATVFTTNLDFSQLDGRLASRLRDVDISTIVDLDLPDFRLQSAKDKTDYKYINLLNYYSHMTFEKLKVTDKNGQLAHAIEQASDYAARRTGGWFIIIGNTGTGKTHLSAAIANYMREKRRQPIIYTTMVNMLDYLRGTFGNNMRNVTYENRYKILVNCPVLFIDDLQLSRSSEWAQERVFELLDHRFVRNMMTVITYNTRVAWQMRDEFPDLYSRMRDRDRSQYVLIGEEDYRVADSTKYDIHYPDPL